MTRSSTTRTRLFTIAAMLLLASIALTRSASAQQLCACDFITVDVGNVCVPITVQPTAPLCRYESFTIPQNTSVQIACCQDMSLTITTTCDGSTPTFTGGGPTCIMGIPVQPGCCVNACIVTIRGCQHLVISSATPTGVKCGQC